MNYPSSFQFRSKFYSSITARITWSWKLKRYLSVFHLLKLVEGIIARLHPKPSCIKLGFSRYLIYFRLREHLAPLVGEFRPAFVHLLLSFERIVKCSDRRLFVIQELIELIELILASFQFMVVTQAKCLLVPPLFIRPP